MFAAKTLRRYKSSEIVYFFNQKKIWKTLIFRFLISNVTYFPYFVFCYTLFCKYRKNVLAQFTTKHQNDRSIDKFRFYLFDSEYCDESEQKSKRK